MFYVPPPMGALALLALISRESTFYLYEVKVESWTSTENDETSILAIEEIITFLFHEFPDFCWRDFKPQKLLLSGGYKIHRFVKMYHSWVPHVGKKLYVEASQKL